MLAVTQLGFQYTPKKKVVHHISFSLDKGEHLCIMGESGSGKSTLLQLIYGLLDATEGSVSWHNTPVLGPSHHLIPGYPSFKYVAQDFDLMPYTSVAENIGKFLSNFFPEEKAIRTKELLEVIDMTAFADSKVKNLSGGQQQRVAIARALAKEPEVLLLDEPFSQIDNFKKSHLRRRLFSYLKKNNISCIVATHDGHDALSFADQLLVIKNYTSFALGAPKDIYHQPNSLYVAALFDDVNVLKLNGTHKNTSILLYPNDIFIVAQSSYKGVVESSYFKGGYWLLSLYYNDQLIFVNHAFALEEGKEVCFDFDPDLISVRSID